MRPDRRAMREGKQPHVLVIEGESDGDGGSKTRPSTRFNIFGGTYSRTSI